MVARTDVVDKLGRLIILSAEAIELTREGKRTKEQTDQLLLALQEYKEIGNDLLQTILNRERQAHKNFYGQEFDISKFEKTLKKYGREKIKEWQKLGLEPHFPFPKGIKITKDSKFPGWKIKPKNWYFEQIAKGNILIDIDGNLEPINVNSENIIEFLEDTIVLIDTRLKPNYQDGRQIWKNDNLLGLIIEKLRKEKKIAEYEYGKQSSRFGASADEWEKEIKPALVERLGLQVRLETALEANIIPQMYCYMPREDDGNTNTWCWHEEYFEDRGGRLNGGNSDNGGLAGVGYGSVGDRWNNRSVRPLEVL
ncbi:MAG: hypothetical protein ABH887_01835 [bacterium]